MSADPTAEHVDAVAERQAGAANALWNQANLVGQAIDQGRLDGTSGAAVAAAIRATTPEEFARACSEVTAPDPTAEHIDAVARSITVTSRDGNGRRVVSKDASLSVARLQARTLLASTDPAVHAAILAALVRAGVLTEDRERLVRACGCIANEEPAACCDPLASPHWERRYVTSWQVAP